MIRMWFHPIRQFVFLISFLSPMLKFSEVVGTSCYCTTTKYASNGTCDIVDGTCFRMVIQVASNETGDYRGCVKSQLPKDTADSLSIVIIPEDLVIVAVFQCSEDDCDNGTGVAGRWSGIGVGKSCQFKEDMDEIEVQWKADGTVSNFTKEWCPNCQEVDILQPSINETLCQWSERITNWTTLTTQLPRSVDENHLYIGSSIFGLILLAGIALGIVEYIKAKKAKRSKTSLPKKKGAKERMVTTLLPPPKKKTTPPGTTEAANGKKQTPSGTKGPASTTKVPVSASKEPGSVSKEPASGSKEPSSGAKEPAAVPKEPPSPEMKSKGSTGDSKSKTASTAKTATKSDVKGKSK